MTGVSRELIGVIMHSLSGGGDCDESQAQQGQPPEGGAGARLWRRNHEHFSVRLKPSLGWQTLEPANLCRTDCNPIGKQNFRTPCQRDAKYFGIKT